MRSSKVEAGEPRLGSSDFARYTLHFKLPTGRCLQGTLYGVPRSRGRGPPVGGNDYRPYDAFADKKLGTMAKSGFL